MLSRVFHRLRRLSTPLSFGDLTRTEPASRVFGLDRGTPIDRLYIESFLGRHRSLVQGRVLEVGDDTYARRFRASSADPIDVLHPVAGAPGATVIGDLTRLETLPKDAFDCFICTQTLCVIFDLQAAVRGIHHLLRPGGVVLATLPGITQISRFDEARSGDFWRFTRNSAQKLFEPLFGPRLRVETQGNLLAAKAILDGAAVEDLPRRELLFRSDPEYPVLISVWAQKAER